MPVLILTVSDFRPPDVSSVLHFSINNFCIFSANPSSIMHFFNQLCESFYQSAIGPLYPSSFFGTPLCSFLTICHFPEGYAVFH